ncbi:MAG: hypothetical protein JWQ20_3453 [Conexibacter sp.]|nr:hypothetical protein [Conexibacter sp.]
MLFFVDESGIDLHEAPCSVLAAVGIRGDRSWEFAQRFSALKREILRFPDPEAYDAKGSKLLKRRVFRQAEMRDPMPADERSAAVEEMLRKNQTGQPATAVELCALAQAKLAFVEAALHLAADLGVVTFASVVPRDAPQQRDLTILRKDWAYLFQRMHCLVCDQGEADHGILLFDELDPALSQRLLSQIRQYFIETGRGRDRARRILPLPFFVHSDLTPQIQLADLVAYIVNWGWRMNRMPELARPELAPFATQAFAIRYQGNERRGKDGARSSRRTWGFAYIPDLRSRDDRMGDGRSTNPDLDASLA